MSDTVVIHIHAGIEDHFTGESGRQPDDYVYIGRAFRYRGKRLGQSKWANPFRIGDHGHTREQVIALYERNVRLNHQLMAELPELRGKVLMCWCAPPGGLTTWDNPVCHGQVLLKLLAELGGET